MIQVPKLRNYGFKPYKKWTGAQRQYALELSTEAKRRGLIKPSTKCKFCGTDKGPLQVHCEDYEIEIEVVEKMLLGTATDEDLAQLDAIRHQCCRQCYLRLHQHENVNDEDLAFIKDCIQSCQWRWAKTMPTIPHEYIVRGRCALTEDDFVRFVEIERRHGVFEHWRSYRHQYLYIDGYKYWSMGNPIDETTIINRQKIFGEYDRIAHKLLCTKPSGERAKSDAALSDMLVGMDGSIFDIGCGKGELIEILKDVSPEDYNGIEPSKHLCEAFAQRHQSYTVINAPFEETGAKYIEYDYVVALYGAASYIMTPYLQMVAAQHRGLFLMFYKPGYIPEEYSIGGETMHHFEWTAEQLASLFIDCTIFPWGNYYIVQSQSIKKP